MVESWPEGENERTRLRRVQLQTPASDTHYNLARVPNLATSHSDTLKARAQPSVARSVQLSFDHHDVVNIQATTAIFTHSAVGQQQKQAYRS